MIIDEENIRVQYESTAESPIVAGDVLPFPYRFTEKEQLNAVLLDGTKLVYKQDYTVGETSITLSVDIPIGETITIYRSTPLDQGSEFPQEAKFNSKKIEDALDKLTMQNQEQREALGRALKLPLTASTYISDLALPNPDPNKSVKWNAEGTALVNTDFDPDLALALTENFKDQAQQAAVEAENQKNVATEQATIATQQADIATEKTTEVVQAKEEAVTIIKDTEASSLTKINSEFNKANEWFEKLNAIPYIPVGTILPTTGAIDESLGYQRYANGQLIANVSSQAPDLVKFLEFQETHAPNLLCSEIEWQAALTLSTLGQVGKYVWNKEEDSVRIPRIVNIQGMMDMNTVGNMVEAGLPNITGDTRNGNLSGVITYDHPTIGGGAILITNIGYPGGPTGADKNFNRANLSFDASRSNPIYGNSNTVQEESILYPYVLQIATGVQYKTPVQNELERIVPYSFGNHKYSNVQLNNTAWVRSVGQWNSAKTHRDYYNWLAEERRNPKDISKTINVNSFGAFTNNSGLLSDFQTLKGYVTLPKSFNPGTSTWEQVYSVITGPDIQTRRQHMQCTDGANNNDGIGCTFLWGHANTAASLGKATLLISINGAWYSPTNIGTKVYEPNTKYVFKISYNGEQYKLQYSEDNGLTFIDDIVIDLSTPITPNSKPDLLGDSWQRNVVLGWSGSIDLNECYINIDGKRWWSGMKSPVRLHTEDYGPEDWVINQSEQTFRLPLVADRVLVDKTGSDKRSYCLYSDGFLEQRGYAQGSGTTVNLYKAYKTKSYLINLGGGDSTDWGNSPHSFTFYNITSNSFQIKMEEGTNLAVGMNCDWKTEGYAEIPTEEQRTMNKYLYFYVGGVAKNEHLVDVGRIEEKIETLIPDNSKLISCYGMPSNKYIDLTLGASGTTYTAPANGYYNMSGTGTGAFYLAVEDKNTRAKKLQACSNVKLSAFVPVSKGDICGISYDALNHLEYFRFIYAEGEV